MPEYDEMLKDVALTKYVCVDSRDRDKSNFPQPNSYVITFPDTIFQVWEVELVYAQYQRFAAEFYIYLILDECSPNSIVMNNSTLQNAFTILPLNGMFNEYNSSMYKSVKRFFPFKAKLDHLTIRFVDQNGKPANMQDHLLRFEIRTFPPRADAATRDMNTITKVVKSVIKLDRLVKTMDNVLKDQMKKQEASEEHVSEQTRLQDAQISNVPPHRVVIAAATVGVLAAAYASHKYGWLSRLKSPFAAIF